jgi:pimeloyl-ACP methyl ester carboxylesterase
MMPPGAGKVPVVLIVAGSGPTDRDGNNRGIPGRNDAYKMLAAGLARDGVASVRYDKRGVGGSEAAIGTGGEAALRFDTYVDDAAQWIKQMRGDTRFSRVIVAGHSEGSLVGMIAARRAGADAFVSIAGVAKRASDVLRAQLRPQLAPLPALLEGSEAVLASLEAGRVMDPLPQALQQVPALSSLYRPGVQPYLISWIRYVPTAEIAQLTVPVVILQGTNDIQVDPSEAKALAAAKPGAELIVIDGMSHVLKIAPADRAQNLATYGNPDLPIVPEVPRAIAALAKRIAKP